MGKVSARFAGVFFAVVITCNISFAKYSGGSGTPEDPYRIADYNDLYALADNTNDYDKHFVMTNDIDLDPNLPGRRTLTTALIAPDTNDDSGFQGTPFNGIFDGNDRCVSGLTIYVVGLSNGYLGLFGCVDTFGALLTNITLSEPNITAPNAKYVGALVGRNPLRDIINCTIINCTVAGASISGGDYVGGLAGLTQDSNNCSVEGQRVQGRDYVGGLFGEARNVSNCTARVQRIKGRDHVGGLIGYAQNICNCTFEGQEIEARDHVGGLVGRCIVIGDCNVICNVLGEDRVGGLVGYAYSIADSEATGFVQGYKEVGGLAGLATGLVERCSANCNVVGTNDEIGGLVGDAGGIVSLSAAKGSTQGHTYVGGLVGWLRKAEIHHSYANVDVNGYRDVGGLVGVGEFLTKVKKCYSTGLVTGLNSIGGLMGRNYDCETEFSFWDINSSGITYSAAGTPKTTAEMKIIETFLDWACDGVWTIDDGNDYPRLEWENLPGEPLDEGWFAGGSGTDEDPYLVATAEQLNIIGTVPCLLRCSFKLTSDIDLSEFDGQQDRPRFNRIGSDEAIFSGTFDGDGHTITNFTYCSDGEDGIGLFGRTWSASIRDLGLADPCLDAGSGRNVGALVGHLDDHSEIQRCYVKGGNVTGWRVVGGLVGLNRAFIKDCWSSATVEASWDYAGGLLGENSYSTLNNSFSTGVSSDMGLVGRASGGTVSGCFWDVESSGAYYSAAGTGLTTEEMQRLDTYLNAAWDFNDIWDICENLNYPRLQWSIPLADLVCPDGVDFFDYSVLADQWLLEKLDADMTNDGRVNLHDFAVWANQWQGDYSFLENITQNWLARSATIADIAPADGDDFVDWLDLAILAENWLK